MRASIAHAHSFTPKTKERIPRMFVIFTDTTFRFKLPMRWFECTLNIVIPTKFTEIKKKHNKYEHNAALLKHEYHKCLYSVKKLYGLWKGENNNPVFHVCISFFSPEIRLE